MKMTVEIEGDSDEPGDMYKLLVYFHAHDLLDVLKDAREMIMFRLKDVKDGEGMDELEFLEDLQELLYEVEGGL